VEPVLQSKADEAAVMRQALEGKPGWRGTRGNPRSLDSLRL
jgi:hypothetical protein